jgi:hypothetical protein
VEATAGAGNLLRICRAMDETMVAKTTPDYMKNMTLPVCPEDSTKSHDDGGKDEKSASFWYSTPVYHWVTFRMPPANSK